MPDRLPPPGPSFIREREVRIGELVALVGMSRPSTLDDGWWLTVLWVHDHEGVVSFRDLVLAANVPHEPPIVRLGPLIAGGLSGMILEEDRRLSIRLVPLVPPADPSRPWDVPAVVRAAFKWEPTRAGTMRPNELADWVAAAFARAVERL